MTLLSVLSSVSLDESSTNAIHALIAFYWMLSSSLRIDHSVSLFNLFEEPTPEMLLLLVFPMLEKITLFLSTGLGRYSNNLR